MSRIVAANAIGMAGMAGSAARVAIAPDAVHFHPSPGQFVTFVVAVLTPGEPDVQLLSAGHGPLLVHRAATATVETLDAHALTLGVDRDEPFDHAGRVRLAPGDALVLLTDGFFEWRRADGEMYGVGRVRQTIVHAPADPERLIAALRSGVEAFAAGASQADDLTAVVVLFKGGTAQA